MKKIGVFLSMFPEAHETFILRELAMLDRRGVDFEIFSLQYPRDRDMHPDAARLRERTHYAPLFGLRALFALCACCLTRPLRLAAAVLTVAAATLNRPRDLVQSLAIFPLTLHFGRLARQRGVAHLHGHWRNVPTTACWILGLIYELPWSAAIHGEDIFSPNRFLRKKLAAAVFIVVCNHYSWLHLRERLGLPRPKDVHLNYHGLDELVWRTAAEAPRGACPREARQVMLAVGRLFRFKGYDYTLAAAARLAARGVDFELRIVGTGPEEGNLRAAAARLGVESRVSFLGKKSFPEVLEQMQRADVLVQASIYMEGDHFDGIPNVIAEAMALGTPVVATRVSGIPELVEDGVSGILVAEKDPESLANAAELLLTDAALAVKLAENAKCKVRKLFDQERNVSELVELFAKYAV